MNTENTIWNLYGIHVCKCTYIHVQLYMMTSDEKKERKTSNYTCTCTYTYIITMCTYTHVHVHTIIHVLVCGLITGQLLYGQVLQIGIMVGL